MTSRFYSNKAAAATLTSDVASGDPSITLDTVSGFPSSFPFTLVIDPDTVSVEVVSVTAIVGTTASINRGQDGTTAVSHSTGASVIHAHTAQDFKNSRDHENASAGVHGLTGAVVGTTDTQTMTNKNLTSGTNSFPSTLATLSGTQTLLNKDLTSGTNTFATTALNPPGAIIAFAGAVAPSGWLICDGTTRSRTTQAALFAAIGTTWGAGDGSTTFNLPDLRSRFPVGAGSFAALGGDEGDSEAARTTAHTHNAGTLDTSDYVMADSQNTAIGGTAGRLQGSAGNITHKHNVTGATASDSNVPYASVNWIIKT